MDVSQQESVERKKRFSGVSFEMQEIKTQAVQPLDAISACRSDPTQDLRRSTAEAD
jgi:hypothetical protein